MTQMLKLITFDVTGTLMVFQPPVAVKYSESAKKFGISVDPKDIEPNFRAHWKELSKSHPNFGRDTNLGWRVWWKQLVMKTIKSATPLCDEKALKQLAEYLLKEYETTRCFTLADGALDILSLLKEKGTPLGVISNYDERLETVLKSLQINSYFDFIITSYSAGIMKPDKKIFDMARSQINGMILPKHCAHIGNSIKLDFEGAKNAGWNPFYVGAVDENILNIAGNNNVFENLTELRRYFEKSLFCTV